MKRTALIEAIAAGYLPQPRERVEAVHPAVASFPDLTLTQLARISWCWQHVQEWREDTFPSEKAWDWVCGEMAQQTESLKAGSGMSALLERNPRRYAECIAEAAKCAEEVENGKEEI